MMMHEILVAWALGCVGGQENLRVKYLSPIIGHDQIIFKTEKSRNRSKSMFFRNMEANTRRSSYNS